MKQGQVRQLLVSRLYCDGYPADLFSIFFMKHWWIYLIQCVIGISIICLEIWSHVMWCFTSVICLLYFRYDDVIISSMASQTTRLDRLLNRLFRHRSKKTPTLCFTGRCVREIQCRPVNSSHKGPVTRKVFPFDDVTMVTSICVVVFYYRCINKSLVLYVFHIHSMGHL